MEAACVSMSTGVAIVYPSVYHLHLLAQIRPNCWKHLHCRSVGLCYLIKHIDSFTWSLRPALFQEVPSLLRNLSRGGFTHVSGLSLCRALQGNLFLFRCPWHLKWFWVISRFYLFNMPAECRISSLYGRLPAGFDMPGSSCEGWHSAAHCRPRVLRQLQRAKRRICGGTWHQVIQVNSNNIEWYNILSISQIPKS
jgi:hypothetical protein